MFTGTPGNGSFMPVSNELNRRSFIVRVGLGTVLTRVAGAWIPLRVTARAENGFGTGMLRLKLSDYPALQQDFGSVRIGSSQQFGAFPAGLFYPVLINRAPGGVYHALDSECPHEGCTVPPFDADSQKMVCPCHFSEFQIDGSYITGPANASLRKFNTTLKDGFLVVEIPNIPFVITFERATAQADRLALEFNAFGEITYEVQFRAALSDTASSVKFALSESAPFDQDSLLGTGDVARIYVPIQNANGVYSVVMRTQEV